MAIDFDTIYDNLDKMQKMKRYRAPSPGYFPTVAEINTYATQGDKFEHMIPYLMWLDECLTNEERENHKEAVRRFNEILAELDEEDDVDDNDDDDNFAEDADFEY